MMTRRPFFFFKTAGIAVLLLGVMQGTAMAKMVLFSAVQGRVLLAGKPVAGATLERSFHWAWKSEDGSDSTSTNAAGEFSLPVIERSSFLGSLLPHEPVIKQSILIQHGGKSYKAWMSFKRDYDSNSENQGKPIKVTCNLDAEPLRRGEIMGLCEFN